MNTIEQLVTHKPTRGLKKDDVVIQVTDFSLHSTEHEKTKSLGKKIVKGIKNQEPTRVYFPTTGNPVADQQLVQLEMNSDPELIALVKETQAKGNKVFLSVPKSGVPLKLGDDTKQFLKSKRGKRVLRGLAKKTDD